MPNPETKPKFLLTVKPPAGLIVLDTPRPLGQGAAKRRVEVKGAQLYAYDIFTFEGGVRYALLVPREPGKPEWVRVAEAGSLVPEYVDVKELAPSQEYNIAEALDRFSGAVDRHAVATSAQAEAIKQFAIAIANQKK